MGQCASIHNRKRTRNRSLNRTAEPANVQEDDHQYDEINNDLLYDEIEGIQIVDNVPADASSSTGQTRDSIYDEPLGNLDISYDDAFSCPMMPRKNSHSERGNMGARSEVNSQSSTYSSYSDPRPVDNNGNIMASKLNYTSLRSLVSVGEDYQMLFYDVETMVEIYRDIIEEDVDARRIVIYLTFLPYSYEREINQIFKESPKKSMKMLIDKIKEIEENGKWDSFVKALLREGYENIAKKLRGDFQDDNRDKRSIVRIFAPTLVHQINPLEIIPLLYARNIISPSDKEEIERENCNFGRIAAARRLLRCLHHKSSSWFEQFCDILKECEYSDLVEMLNPKTARFSSQDSEMLSYSEQRPARTKPKRQSHTEEELQKSLRELQLVIDNMGTTESGQLGQGKNSRREECTNSHLQTAVHPGIMAAYRTIIEDKATEILNELQKSLEQAIHQILIPEYRLMMEEILSCKLQPLRDEIRAVRDDVSRESRNRAWVYRTAHYRQSSSGYCSGNSSTYEPIQETDEEEVYTIETGI